MASSHLSYAENIYLNYDPEQALPKNRMITAADRAAAGLPDPIPWPADYTPTPVPLSPAPADTDSLARFVGYDAVVMTYTAAEAASLATLFTPENLVSTWYNNRHNKDAYVPLVTGSKSPFATSPHDSRYYQSLGLYFPCTIGKAKVLLIKSGLHMDYDGIAPDGTTIAFYKMVAEVVGIVRPKIFITTGTGGGIGDKVKLGDIIIATKTRFDCTSQFASQPWHSQSYSTSTLPPGTIDLIQPGLTVINGQHIASATPIPGNSVPKIWHSSSNIVTTDKFAFDTSYDDFKLQGLGDVCDMGDAMVGRALASYPQVLWYAIRNASDPQIPMKADTKEDLEQADKEAGEIYQKYGGYTTAASVIATWAIIAALAQRL